MIHIGYALGAYDLFHLGHLNLLKQAKAHCDILILGVVAELTLHPQRVVAMKTCSIYMFKYDSRTTDCEMEGPIRFAIGQTVQGKMLVGRSQHGICILFLSECAQTPRDQLAAAFSAIGPQATTASLERELNQVVAYIGKGLAEGIINLDIGSLVFEQKVWQTLCGIPASKIRSDSDVARVPGVLEDASAFSGVFAANALAIPCHHVVCSDNSISGSRWGVERKCAQVAGEATEILELAAWKL